MTHAADRGAPAVSIVIPTRSRPEPLRWNLGLLAYPFRRNGVRRALPLAALLAVAQVVTAVGVGVEKVYLRTPSKRKTVTPP